MRGSMSLALVSWKDQPGAYARNPKPYIAHMLMLKLETHIIIYVLFLG